MRGIGIAILAVLALGPPAAAQQSASYELSEHSFDSGGGVMTSTSFKLTYDAIAETAVSRGLASASFGMDASFGSAYPPPGEVAGIRFTGKDTLVWSPEKSLGTYDAYRDRISNLSGLGSGACWQAGLTTETASDYEKVPSHDGYFYLVTASNRLEEEGTKGYQSGGTERRNDAPCP